MLRAIAPGLYGISAADEYSCAFGNVRKDCFVSFEFVSNCEDVTVATLAGYRITSFHGSCVSTGVTTCNLITYSNNQVFVHVMVYLVAASGVQHVIEKSHVLDMSCGDVGWNSMFTLLQHSLVVYVSRISLSTIIGLVTKIKLWPVTQESNTAGFYAVSF